MRSPHFLHFNLLSPSLRQHLAAVLRPHSPSVVLTDPPAAVNLKLMIALGLALGLLAWPAPRPLGASAWTWIHAPFWMWLGFVLSIAALEGLRRRAARRALPFRAGRYLLPFELVDARKARLRVYDLTGARVELVHTSFGSLHLRSQLLVHLASGETQALSMRSKFKAEAALQRFELMCDQAREALDQRDLAALAWLDPFLALRCDKWECGPLKPVGPRARRVPRFLRWRVPLALAGALLVALPASLAQCYVRDRAQYVEAARLNTAYAYRLYLSHGWAARREARNALEQLSPALAGLPADAQ